MKNINLFRLCRVFILISLITTNGECNDSLPVYSDPGSAIEMQAGQEFAIAINSKPEANYQWQFAKPLDQNMLALLDMGYKSAEDENPRFRGKEVFVFRTLSGGTTMISLIYSRDGERDMYPLESKSFIIEIK